MPVEYLTPEALAQMSEEQIREFKAQFPADTQFEVGQTAVSENPDALTPEAFSQMTPEQLADFSVQLKGKWSPYTHAESNPDVLADANAKKRLVDTDYLLRQRGFHLSDIDWKSVAKAPIDLAGGLIRYGGKVVTTLAAPQAEIYNILTGGEPGTMLDVGKKAAMEAGAATELSATGTMDLARKGFQKIGRGLHIAKPLDQFTEADKDALFSQELDIRKQLGKVATGKGEALTSLASDQMELDPEEVSKTAAGDPLTFAAFSGGFKIINAVTGKVLGTAATKLGAQQAISKLNALRGGMQQAERLAKEIPSAENLAAANQAAIDYYATRGAAGALPQAGEAVSRAVEAIPSTAQVVGKGIEVTGAGLEKAAPATGVAAGIAGLVSGNPWTLLGMLGGRGVRGFAAPAVEKVGETMKTAGGAIFRGDAEGWTRALSDALNVPQNIIKGGARGLPMDLTLAAVTSETPEETGTAPMMMTGIGALHGVVPSVRSFVQGQTIAPRKWAPSNSWSKGYGSFPGLDTAHAATMKIASEGVRERIGALRDLASTTGTEVYQFQGPTDMAKALEGSYGPAEAANIAQANAVFIANMRTPEGTRKVILLRDPAAAPHEVGHPLESIFTQDQQNRLYGQVEAQYGHDGLLQRAFQEAHALAATPEAQAQFANNWGEFLLKTSGMYREGMNYNEAIAAIKHYAAKEIIADTIGTVVAHGSPEMLKDNTFLGNTARVIAKTMLLLGQDPYAGVEAQGPFATEIKFPVAEQVREMVQPFGVEAREAVIRPEVTPKTAKAPETPEAGAQKAKEWVDQNPTGNADRDQAVTGLADALASRQGIRVLYWGAKGDPGGQVTSVRPERRAEIESQRSAENKDRILAEKEIFPYKVEMHKNGPQFVGWSPDNFDANVGKFAEWLGYLSRKGIDVSTQVPYEFNKQLGRFTAEGRADLLADAQAFMENQRAGFTGAGGELVVPAEVEARGFFSPEKTGATPQALEQSRADIVNYLFNIQIPETVRRVAPLHLAAQEVSEATLPGRVVEPVRPRGEYPPEKLAAVGLEAPRRVQEVNPFRQWVEQTSKDSGVARPSLIEVSQRLNIPRIEKTVPSLRPEHFGGNVMTLAAGFQPSSSPRAVKMAAIKDRVTGEIFEGSWHGEAMMKALEARSTRPLTEDEIADSYFKGDPSGVYEDGFTTNGGEFLNREQAHQRAIEVKQMDAGEFARRSTVGEDILESDAFADVRRFQPGPQMVEQARKIAEMTLPEFATWAREEAGRGGYTQAAIDTGMSAPDMDFVNFLKDQQTKSAAATKEFLAKKDFTNGMASANRTQFFREAYEAATGTGSVGSVQPGRDPNYKPPFPLPETQAQPRPQIPLSDEPEAIKTAAVKSLVTSKLYAGKTHYDAQANLRKSEPEGLTSLEDISYGYVTRNGKFLNREKALKRAIEYGQVTENFKSEGGSGLDSEQFYQERVDGTTAQAQPLQRVFLGKIDENGKIESRLRDSGVLHSDVGMFASGTDRLFRYSPQTKTVYWHGEPPGDELKNLVKSYYEQHPNRKVEKHVNIARDVQAYAVVHGLVDVTPDATREARRKAAEQGIPFVPETELQPQQRDFDTIQEELQKAKDESIYIDNIIRGYTKNPDKSVDWEAKAKESLDNEHRLLAELEAHPTSFQPRLSDEPEAIRGAAVKSPETGKIFEGKTHYEATEKLRKAEGTGSMLDAQLGFVTNNRKEFLDRTQAYKRAREYDQLPEKYSFDSERVLESVTFNRAMEAQPGDKFPKVATGAAFRKAWILPNGKTIQLGDMWHSQWLDQNRDTTKKFGLRDEDVPKFEGTDTEDTRQSALKRGFARVNYSISDGRLVLEARAADWKKVRDAYERLVEANLDDIDVVRVNLTNRDVSDILDSQEVQLFRIKKDADKLKALPFLDEPLRETVKAPVVPETPVALPAPGERKYAVFNKFGNYIDTTADLNLAKEMARDTGGSYKAVEVTTAQAQPRFAAPEFAEELTKVREGESFGQTFNPDGTVWSAKTPSDIVTLASANLPKAEATPENVSKALEPFAELLSEPGIAAGVFSFEQAGKPMVSVDVNLIVPQKFRDNTVEFAKANNQVAIWDAAKNETVETGGTGDTTLKDVASIKPVIPKLLAGEKVTLQAQAGERPERSSVKYFTGLVPPLQGTGFRGAVTTWDATRFLSEENAKIGKLDKPTEENARKHAEVIADEAEYALSQDQNALGWYDRKLSEMKDIIVKMHPELAKDSSRFTLYKALLAVNSNGMDIYQNLKRTEYLYEKWKKTGELETTGAYGGKNSPAINKGIQTLSELINKFGLDKVNDFLSQDFTVGELEDSGYIIPGELRDTRVKAAVILGPKIGSFFGNLNGDYSSVTMDRWFMRTFRRQAGTLTDVNLKVLPKQIDAVLSAFKGVRSDLGYEFAPLRDTLREMKKAAEEGTLTSQDVQDRATDLSQWLWERYRRYTGSRFTDRVPQNTTVKTLYENLFSLKHGEKPKTGREREWIRRVMGKAQEMLRAKGIELTNADLQALLWYYEKDLHAKFYRLTERAVPTDYAEAAAKVAAEKSGHLPGPKQPGRGGKGMVEPREQPISSAETGPAEQAGEFDFGPEVEGEAGE